MIKQVYKTKNRPKDASAKGMRPWGGSLECDALKMKITGHRTVTCYFISCSKFSKRGEVKKSRMEISKPSQIFWIVDTVVVELRPLTTLFRVDCVMPQTVESLFSVIPFCAARFFT